MQPFWGIVASNALLVVVLAAGVALLGRVWKNPLCLHLLWVFVLLKLITPPLVTIPITSLTKPIARTSRVDASRTEPAFTTAVQERRSPLHDFAISESSRSDHDVATIANGMQQMPWFLVLGWVWGVGIVVFASGQAYRIVHFKNLLRSGQTPSSALLDTAEGISKQLGLKRIPEIRLLPVYMSPLVWSFGGRPRVFLPSALFERLDGAAQQAILAHELAHVRRGDPWIRLLEMVFTTLFWWHPVVWLAARQLQELEDQCCDAMAVDLAPHSVKSYAVALLDTLDFLCDRPSIAAPLGAMAANPSVSLTRRIEMLKNRSWTTRWTLGRLVLVFTVTALPMTVAFGQKTPQFVVEKRTVNRLFPEKTDLSTPEQSLTQVAMESNKKAAEDASNRSQPPYSPKTSEFPYLIEFEQGASRFNKGDNITIQKVRGTAPIFMPGNIYWIRGTYTLASHDQAVLATFTTARNAAEGKTHPLLPQKIHVRKGTGTFTLLLPMLYEGWPHVSFYPVGGGEGFGGNYFGTDESVLKRWKEDSGKISTSPESTTFTVGHFDEVGWNMLKKQDPHKFQGLYGRWPMTDQYNQALKNDIKSGDSVLVLLSLQDLPDVPKEFSDFLILPRPEIESRLKQGQTVFKQGTIRGLDVFLVATPRDNDLRKEFRRLVAEGKFALDKEAATNY